MFIKMCYKLTMKKYVAVVDISPSEQISSDDTELKFMAVLFGLKSTTSIDKVGSDYPVKEEQFKLRKWSGSSTQYKRGFIKHAETLVNSGNIIFGINVSSNAVIRNIGKHYWELIMGKIPKPLKHNKKGRPLVPIGIIQKSNSVILPAVDILADDLFILGWYAEALVSCLKCITVICNEQVKLDVIIDNLPNEQGGKKRHKARMLKQICLKGSKDLLSIIGVPEKADSIQRELLVDSMAGLYREIVEDNNSLYKDAKSLYKFNRFNK